MRVWMDCVGVFEEKSKKHKRLVHGLKACTALTTGAFALLVLGGHAVAANLCTGASPATIECSGAGNPYEQGIHYASSGAVPEDLTIHLSADTNISTTADHTNGVDAYNDTGGKVTVSGDQGSTIITSGQYSHGVRAIATDNDVDVSVDTVSTSGKWSNGIYASSNYGVSTGNVTVKAGTVTTYGDGSKGIRAAANAGNISVTAYSVNAWGYGSDAVDAQSTYGDTTLNLGNVVAGGATGRGIVAYSEGTTTVNVDQVRTFGAGYSNDADAGGIKAVGTKVDVTVTGAVVTLGDYSTAIYANTNHQQFDPTIVDPNITVSAGSVQTSGNYAHGIVAINKAEIGKTSISVGTVNTAGYHSFGIYGAAYSDVAINADKVSTTGPGSSAVAALSIYGNIDVHVGTLQTAGAGSTGIDTINYSTGKTTIGFGAVETRRDYSTGIDAASNGSLSISGDTVVTNGYDSQGVIATSYSGGSDIKLGSISTNGDHSNALDAVTVDGATNIAVGTIHTTGDHSVGIYSMNISYADTTITAGNVTIDGAFGAGIVAQSAGWGAVNVKADTISVTGLGTLGVKASALDNDINLTIDKIVSTGGDYHGATGTAVTLSLLDGNAFSHFGEISTTGDHAMGIFAVVDVGTNHILVDRDIKTTGAFSIGVFASGNQTQTNLDFAGNISTSGLNAFGIKCEAIMGDCTVNSAGTITTSGDNATGINAIAYSYGREAYTQYGETEPFLKDGTIHINANSISTSGANADGISVVTMHDYKYGDLPIFTDAVAIKTGTVSVTGANSNGIKIDARRTAVLDTGNTSSIDGNAIKVSAGTKIDLNVRGVATSSTKDAVVLSGKDINIGIAKAGNVTGSGSAITLNATGIDPTISGSVPEPFGQIVLSNIGTVAGGTDYAVMVEAGEIKLNNSGQMIGGIHFADGNDSFENAGRFVVTKSSDFGKGSDTFTNTGTVAIAPSSLSAALKQGPLSVAFANLEQFNNSGLIDLRNGVAGDVFTIDGSYKATGDAQLGLDIGATADKLVITGKATGVTTIFLSGVTPQTAALSNTHAASLVQVGAGSDATFNIGNSEIGLVHYNLNFNASSNSYQLQSAAGSSVYGTLSLQDGAQSAWMGEADAWSSYLASMRGDSWANGSVPVGKQGVWVQAYGSTADHETAALSGGEAKYELGLSGGQFGTEFYKSHGLAFGVTAGMSQSTIKFNSSNEKVDLRTLDTGAYMTGSLGKYFINGLVKYDFNRFSVSDGAAGFAQNIDGTAFGAIAELGWRFDSGAFAIEPMASLAYLRTSVDALKVLNQTLTFDDQDGVILKIGARFSRTHHLKSGNSLVFTGGVFAVDAPNATQALRFSSGGVTQNISYDATDRYGQATLGLSYKTRAGVSTFIEGKSDFGSERSGTGLTLGARVAF